MTGYTVHTGSNQKFSSGWDRIFQSGPAKKSKSPAQPKAKKGGKKKSRS
jgi:hypothetical protein